MSMPPGDQRALLLRQLPAMLDARLAELEQARKLLGEAVRDLVLAGYSWADVGRMLGVSRQAARQRYGDLVTEWRETAGDQMPWDAQPFDEEDPETLVRQGFPGGGW